jgi:hypothetical protein
MMPSARKIASRPGLKALMGHVNARGMQAIDRRSVAYRAMKEWQAEMLAALGADVISPQRRTLLDLAARTKLFLDHADAYLLALPTLINRRRKVFIALVEQRQRLADSLVRQLQVLGLDRLERDGGALPPEWVTRVSPRPAEREAAPLESEARGDV